MTPYPPSRQTDTPAKCRMECTYHGKERTLFGVRDIFDRLDILYNFDNFDHFDYFDDCDYFFYFNYLITLIIFFLIIYVRSTGLKPLEFIMLQNLFLIMLIVLNTDVFNKFLVKLITC